MYFIQPYLHQKVHIHQRNNLQVRNITLTLKTFVKNHMRHRILQNHYQMTYYTDLH